MKLCLYVASVNAHKWLIRSDEIWRSVSCICAIISCLIIITLRSVKCDWLLSCL